MGLFKKIRNVIHKVDPVSKAIDKKLGNVDKKKTTTSNASTTTARSALTSSVAGKNAGPIGTSQPATGIDGGAAMKTARSKTNAWNAGAKSGVGRLQKIKR